MDKKALRNFRKKREEESNKSDFIKVNWLSPKVGQPIKFKLLSWTDPETKLFFHSLEVQWFKADGKIFPLRVGSPIVESVFNQLKNGTKNMKALANTIKPQETFLAQVIDLDDYQYKVLRIDGDGIDKITEYVLESDVELTSLDNNLVFEVLKEMEQYKNKHGETRNKRKYTIEVLEEETFVLVPRTKEALKDIADLSQIYNVPSDKVATDIMVAFLSENDLSPHDFLSSSPSEEEEVDADDTEEPDVDSEGSNDEPVEPKKEEVSKTTKVIESTTVEVTSDSDLDEVDDWLEDGVE